MTDYDLDERSSSQGKAGILPLPFLFTHLIDLLRYIYPLNQVTPHFVHATLHLVHTTPNRLFYRTPQWQCIIYANVLTKQM
jgi:hypothetical protein